MTGEILTPFHKKILSIFASLEESRAFYFTGGMALSAYYLQHRLSEDIDLFCPTENLIPITAKKFSEALIRHGVKIRPVRSFGSFWEAALSDNQNEIRFQLAYDTPFRLGNLTEQDGVCVHSLDDLAAGKLLALFARAEERDFIDVYCLAHERGYTVERMIELARKKDPGLDEYYLALAFEQAEGLPDDPAKLKLTLLQDIDMLQLKMFFKKHAVAILANHLLKRTPAG